MTALLITLTMACSLKDIEDVIEDTGITDGSLETADADADGYSIDDGDCDDADAAVSPGASELCDDIDNNCDGEVDEGVTITFYADDDGDGYGDPDDAEAHCTQPSGMATDATDCDDHDASSHPDAAEVCDEADNDCDGEVDENVTTTFYADADADGFGLTGSTTAACVLPPGYADLDGDCDDVDGTISPNATEICDEVDNNCDGIIDEDSAADAQAWFIDDDGDGYGQATKSSAVSCTPSSGFVRDSADCDDTDAAIHPVAVEVCDEVDNDCNGWIDEDDPGLVDGETFYADADSDGYGSPDYTVFGCTMPSGYTDNAEDCSDISADTHPGADELCDEVDNDCDGDTDEDAVDPSTWYRDFDGDGFGDPDTTTEDCSVPTGYVDNDGDCADTQLAINPDADEECNDKDDDCDDLIDDDDTDVTDALTWHLDADGDTYGNAGSAVTACDQPTGYVVDSTDCIDTDSAIHPNANEVCDETDNDCDGAVDDDDSDVTGTQQWYSDGDGDGYGNDTDSLAACEQPSGRIPTGGDCDDTDRAIRPGAEELCDDIDNNCDGEADDGLLGSEADCAGADCQDILEDGSGVDDGLYWIAPDGELENAWEAYCDMTTDDGGWTRLFASLYPTWWSATDWAEVGEPEDDDYSAMLHREHFSDSGVTTYRLEMGTSDTWDTGTRTWYTIWSQGHDPFDETSDGSDYSYVDGDESTTCDGFVGLHGKFYDDEGDYTLTSDVDDIDDVDCWGMQVVPLSQYGSADDYPGYLTGYDDGDLHEWQVLWVR